MHTSRALPRAYLRDLPPGLVEAGAAADVGEVVGHERGGRVSICRVAAPEALGQADGARTNPRTNRQVAAHLAGRVEDANCVAVGELARGGIFRMHQELDFGPRQLAKRGADRPFVRW